MDDARHLAAGAVVLVNLFTPKPGQADAFIAAQTAEYDRLRGQVEGALGNRLMRSLDGARLVNLAYFASQAAYDAWVGSALFQDHLGRIRHLVDTVEPGLYTPIYDSPDQPA